MKKVLMLGLLSLGFSGVVPASSLAHGLAGSVYLERADESKFAFVSEWMKKTGCPNAAKQDVYVVLHNGAGAGNIPCGLVCTSTFLITPGSKVMKANIFLDDKYDFITGDVVQAAIATIKAENPRAGTKIKTQFLPLQ